MRTIRELMSRERSRMPLAKPRPVGPELMRRVDAALEHACEVTGAFRSTITFDNGYVRPATKPVTKAGTDT